MLTPIDTEKKLEINLKLFKKSALANGAGVFDVYPLFGLYYQNNQHKFQLPKEIVYNMACDILIGEEE